jgi:hypothetical protein
MHSKLSKIMNFIPINLFPKKKNRFNMFNFNNIPLFNFFFELLSVKKIPLEIARSNT